MSTPPQINLTVAEALAILKQYSCVQVKTVEDEAEKKQLRAAILLITSLCDRENIGICADTAEQGFRALASYLEAMGYANTLDPASIPTTKEPIYIKFNTQKLSYYVDAYVGTYRGVLISCQSEDDKLGGTYGHFPLDLFM
jgi:hypothetical protein